MLKPFYQGKLDSFCAIYAVLNALRLTHGIRTTKARDIFNETLLSLVPDQQLFRDVLTQNTDYVSIIDNMLSVQRRRFPLVVEKPFPNLLASPDQLWNTLAAWLGEKKESTPGRAIVFRFLRFLKPEADPLNRHWTTMDYITADTLHLFDCSHEAEAILNIRRGSFVTRREDVDKDHLLYIQPDTVRFLRLPF